MCSLVLFFFRFFSLGQMKSEAAAAVLGVAVEADPEILKAAYRRLALRWHPDKCKDPNATERFQEVCVFIHLMIFFHFSGRALCRQRLAVVYTHECIPHDSTSAAVCILRSDSLLSRVCFKGSFCRKTYFGPELRRAVPKRW